MLTLPTVAFVGKASPRRRRDYGTTLAQGRLGDVNAFNHTVIRRRSSAAMQKTRAHRTCVQNNVWEPGGTTAGTPSVISHVIPPTTTAYDGDDLCTPHVYGGHDVRGRGR